MIMRFFPSFQKLLLSPKRGLGVEQQADKLVDFFVVQNDGPLTPHSHAHVTADL